MSRSFNKLRFSSPAPRGGPLSTGGSPALAWRLLLGLIVLGVGLGVLHNRWRAQQAVDPALGAPRVLGAPVQQAGRGLDETIGSWWGGLSRGLDAERENRTLRAQVRELTTRNEQLQAKAIEAGRLREMLKMPPARLEKGIVAPVTTVLPSAYFESIAVERGSAQGVRDAWIARTPKGLVGQITETSLLSSQVMLLSDFNSAVSVLVRRAGKIVASGVVRGAGRGEVLDLVFVRREANLKVGDKVVSSGYGGVVPPDVPVGQITKISQRKEMLTQSAKVQPFAGMPGDVREVLLLPSGQSRSVEEKPARPDEKRIPSPTSEAPTAQTPPRPTTTEATPR